MRTINEAPIKKSTNYFLPAGAPNLSPESGSAYKLGGLLPGLGSPQPASKAVDVKATRTAAKSVYFMKISLVIDIKNCLRT